MADQSDLGIVAELRFDTELIGTGRSGETVGVAFAAGDHLLFCHFSESELEIMCQGGDYLFFVPRAAVRLQIPERRSCRPEPPSPESD